MSKNKKMPKLYVASYNEKTKRIDVREVTGDEKKFGMRPRKSPKKAVRALERFVVKQAVVFSEWIENFEKASKKARRELA